ncbi:MULTISPECIES: Bax inhibitor-1/YccA family protein [unclassified Amycolatopsis]|uniref:Bax inhibitor-1/YccA family protein n=1 Tax=unclassified Amycolatopsis TaxID=2618356 RepID=UPI0028770024|nr:MULTISPECIES: Bax inhibitor-1/YccA family protein [unclassified Amycolatopsis]MDS0137483.1 Bax inhibitor-1/YccA family protein [Amycolatopsis sp. 505]MDS0141678.1 Bax inhibitor-1/YccA family protein [Amycolatopsis sp. CM201R]
MRSSSNPAFRNLPGGGTQTYGQYGPPVGFNQPQGGVPGYGPGQAASGEGDRPMTVDDVVVKTGMSLGVALLVGVVTGIWAQVQIAETGRLSGALIGAMLGGLIVGLVISLVIIFRQKPSGALTLTYSAAEGLFLGALSGVFEAIYPGIALQAIIGTAGVFIGMLVVYKTGAVKVTPKLTKWIVGAVVGVAILMLFNLISSLAFGFNPLRDGGPLAIVFSLVCIGIAAFSFLLDFDQADRMIREGMPSKWAWYTAFGLMTTLVWLYLEILRLLSYFRE